MVEVCRDLPSSSGIGENVNARLIHVLGGILPILLALFTTPLTARSLGPENRGILVAVLALGTIISASSNFGLPWASRAALAGNVLASSSLKRQALFLGLKLLPFTVLAALVILSADFDFGLEFGLSVTYVAIMTFSAYSGVCANHLLVYRKTASLGLVTLTTSFIASMLILVFFLNNDLSLVTLLVINCGIQVATTTILMLLSKRLEATQLGGFEVGSPNSNMRIKVNERRFAWFANTLDVLFSKFDVIFLSAAASNYFLGLYSIPGILVGVCYSMFSTISSAGFNSSKVGGASTKLRIAIQLNLMLTFTTFAISGLFLSIALEPIFGAAYSESLSLLATSLGFCLCLSIAVPYIQYSLIRRSSLWPTVGVTVVVTAAALVALKITGSILLSANLLGWFLAIALFFLVAKSQSPPYSFGSKSQFKDFLRAG